MWKRMLVPYPTRWRLHRRARWGLPALSLFMTTAWLVPAHADGSITSVCARTAAASTCTTIWRTGRGGSAGLALWTPRAEREAAAANERERLWLARCRPTLEYDQYGVGRYRYAASGCEFGRYE
jgi:hypothetical protein